MAAVRSLWLLLFGLSLFATVESAVAQVTPEVEPDSVGAAVPAVEPDSVGATLPADSVPADSARAAPPPPLQAAADSVLQALKALPGFTVTEYLGQTAVYTAETGVLRLEGAAEVMRADERLSADTIIYRERVDLVEAYGQPRVQGQDQVLEGERLFYDLARRRATALGARTQITQQATWFVTGDMTVEGTTHLYGSHARFTSCDLAIPHYHFEADEIMVIRDQIIVARPARLYFGDVPVMVLPFVVQNLEQGRRSGLLTPRFGVHDIVRTSAGYNRQISDVGFYWAINEYLGAQVSTTWRSGAYTALFGDLGFNWRRQFLNGNVGLQRYWRAEGRAELGFRTSTSWRPDERTNLALTGNYASSSEFVRDASYDPREVTQDLNSSLRMTRRFDWGQMSIGGDRRQSIATGDVSMTLPTFSISPQAITLSRAAGPDGGNIFSGATFNPGSITGSRVVNDYAGNLGANRQDRAATRFRVGPSLTVGNFTVSASGDLNRNEIQQAAGVDNGGEPLLFPGSVRDEGTWSASASYRQSLIGTTNISPTISLNQQIVRDTLTSDSYLQSPTRLSFGASLSTDLYGFFPGVSSFSAIRHRFSPQISYRYAPEVEQNALQERVFGRAGGRTQNRISLSFNQTWEAKLRTPRVRQEATAAADTLPADTLAADTLRQRPSQTVPTDPEKVTLLSLSTSPFEYDFMQAAEEGTGFLTSTVSNTISSDYLRGLTIQMQHELFDRRDINPLDREDAGRLGRFAPRLSSLSTAFQLGPESALFRWLERFGIGGGDGDPNTSPGVLRGPPEDDDPVPPGQGSFTNNPQGTGGGPWRASIGYQFSRPSRMFSPGQPVNDEAIQTLDGNLSFQLTPKWSVNWATNYSLTDGEFGAHRLNFQRDLHEWQANFNFYQTPNGNTAFEFYVELLHNRELRFDYAERDLGVDRPR